MSFAQDTGYLPLTIPQILDIIRLNVNTQFGTTYDTDGFVGTNWYKYAYAIAQRIQFNEIKTSEIFLRMQEYFAVTNETITRPNTTAPGILSYFASKGFVNNVSVKKPIDADAGKLYVAVNVDSASPTYATTKLLINTILKDCSVAGVVTQGSEVSSITLSNAQSFDFKFALANKIPIKLKLTITLSTNNQAVIPSNTVITNALIVNLMARYRIGLDFAPQKYFSTADAPYASAVKLEYSTDGGSTWISTIYSAAYDALFTFTAADVTLVIS